CTNCERFYQFFDSLETDTTEEQKKQQAEEIKDEPVPTEKAKKLAVMEETEKEISK
ncbi:14817_t:CDS:2, partial [Gigaspora rosea]